MAAGLLQCFMNACQCLHEIHNIGGWIYGHGWTKCNFSLKKLRLIEKLRNFFNFFVLEIDNFLP